jgi:hypothetical protein
MTQANLGLVKGTSMDKMKARSPLIESRANIPASIPQSKTAWPPHWRVWLGRRLSRPFFSRYFLNQPGLPHPKMDGSSNAKGGYGTNS